MVPRHLNVADEVAAESNKVLGIKNRNAESLMVEK